MLGDFFQAILDLSKVCLPELLEHVFQAILDLSKVFLPELMEHVFQAILDLSKIFLPELLERVYAGSAGGGRDLIDLRKFYSLRICNGV